MYSNAVTLPVERAAEGSLGADESIGVIGVVDVDSQPCVGSRIDFVCDGGKPVEFFRVGDVVEALVVGLEVIRHKHAAHAAPAVLIGVGRND